jgi:hypothetical protein
VKAGSGFAAEPGFSDEPNIQFRFRSRSEMQPVSGSSQSITAIRGIARRRRPIPSDAT